MPKLVSITHRALARKLRHAGYVEIRTRRHPVYCLAEKDLTIPVPSHPGDVPKGTLRTIIREMGITVDEFNDL
jgi:predicted RNA binding protein YcfA (HicA-like mRNA interferase family)